MELVIDARKIRDFGIGVYIENLIKGIEGKINFSLLCYERDKKSGRCITVKSRGYSLEEQWEIWRVLHRLKPRLFHSPHYVFPIAYRGRTIITIHDIIHILFPRFFSRAARAYARFILSRGVTRAEKIITVSKRSMDDIVKIFPGAADKIIVIHNGISPVFFNSPEEKILEWAKEFSPYILAVGNNKPHKRFPLLIKEFLKVKKQVPELNLVIAGWEGIKDEGVYTIGKIPKEKLVALYSEAEFLVHPALYEGFGFPPFEAAACGTPVLSSRVGAVEEILGDTVLYLEDENFSEAILYALRNRDKIKEMGKRAKLIVRNLTWEKSADEHLKLYRSLL